MQGLVAERSYLSMKKKKEVFHGSDLEKIEAKYHIKKEDIISFSSNVNPLGVPANLKQFLAEHLDVLGTYPDRDYKELKDVISTYTGASSDHIVVGNGSTELISTFIQIKAPKKAVIIAPTYSEYEREVELAGGTPLYLPLNVNNNFSYDEFIVFSMIPNDADILILCNPNNPSGTAIDQIALTKLLEYCALRDISVLIDETYIEFMEHQDSFSAIPLVSRYQNAIVIRGTSKFFACPGLRLGYAVTSNEDLLASFKEEMRPWSVSSIAEASGKVLFSDHEYMNMTKAFMHKERERVINELRKISGLQVYPTVSNFCLIKILRKEITSKMVFEEAIKEGLLVRDCSSFAFLDATYFRMCFLDTESNDKLIACLKNIFEQN